MLKGETLRIGKNEKIALNIKVPEAVLIKIVSLNDKIYILDETQESYDGGLFMKLKKIKKSKNRGIIYEKSLRFEKINLTLSRFMGI